MEVRYRVLGRGALCLPSSLFKPLQRGYTFYVTNRGISPCYVFLIFYCYHAYYPKGTGEALLKYAFLGMPPEPKDEDTETWNSKWGELRETGV